jgi:hypothetical protein
MSSKDVESAFVERVKTQTTVGCPLKSCGNWHCANHPHFQKPKDSDLPQTIELFVCLFCDSFWNVYLCVLFPLSLQRKNPQFLCPSRNWVTSPLKFQAFKTVILYSRFDKSPNGVEYLVQTHFNSVENISRCFELQVFHSSLHFICYSCCC